MSHVIISAQHLTQKIKIDHQDVTLLKSINLQVYQGEQVAITGRSGSGKSTLLGLLATLDEASGGELWILDQPVHEYSEEQRAKVRQTSIGFVFQSFHLLGHLTALENVMLPLRLTSGFNYQAAEKKATELLNKVGLAKQIQQTPKVLSGGEQQRVAIARALVTDPKIIFADEPTGNLDGETAQEIEKLLFDLNRDMGVTLILVTHHLDLAQRCQTHYELRQGELFQLSTQRVEGDQ